MARWSPPVQPDGAPTLGHDAISLSLFVASVAATVALVSSMCSACGRKSKPASDAAAAAASTAESVADAHGEMMMSNGVGEEKEPEVMLSPELATHGPIAPAPPPLPSTTSRRRLSVSLSKKLSVRVPDKMRPGRNKERKDKVEPEDTLWKKAIILGEKCRIPGEREGECDADAGDMPPGSFRHSSYSRAVSRSNSFAVNQNDAPAAAAAASASAAALSP